ncbi:hypothetical protein [Sinomonas flava]|uniref:hypothetical protein n=1 Tax=Sinomonas flava TaxID=496857 RepID=UPI0039A6A282
MLDKLDCSGGEHVSDADRDGNYGLSHAHADVDRDHCGHSHAEQSAGQAVGDEHRCHISTCDDGVCMPDLD